MRVFAWDLTNFFKGVVRFEKIDGYLFPRRFTQQQSKYLETNNFLNIRSKLTASVILEFETNTRKILFDAILLSTSRDYYMQVNLHLIHTLIFCRVNLM